MSQRVRKDLQKLTFPNIQSVLWLLATDCKRRTYSYDTCLVMMARPPASDLQQFIMASANRCCIFPTCWIRKRFRAVEMTFKFIQGQRKSNSIKYIVIMLYYISSSSLHLLHRFRCIVSIVSCVMTSVMFLHFRVLYCSPSTIGPTFHFQSNTVLQQCWLQLKLERHRLCKTSTVPRTPKLCKC